MASGFKQCVADGMDERARICLSLGLSDVVEVHEIVTVGARKGVRMLLERGLNAETLEPLGYTREGMKRLGFGGKELDALGYNGGRPKPRARPSRTGGSENAAVAADHEENKTGPLAVERLINEGHNAASLKERGVAVQHCRQAGYSPTELLRIGYTTPELARAFSARELRSDGFNAHELQGIFDGPELKGAGFTPDEMRLAGYSVRDLLNLGYNENQIITAGFSVNELITEGLSNRTRTNW